MKSSEHVSGLSEGLCRGAARFLVELGWSWEESVQWLADTAALAQFHRGGTSGAAAQESPSAAPAGMVQQVYRELELLERRGRAQILSGVIAQLARRAATLGSAGLELVLPSALHARDALVALVERESERSMSDRFLAQLRSGGGGAAAMLEDSRSEASSPSEVALGLVQLVRRLSTDDVAWVATVEATLVFGEVRGAREELLAQLADLPPSDGCETNEEAALRERCMRLLVLAHFLLLDDEAALELMEAIPLALDRSASMGTLRTAAHFRLGQEAGQRRPRDEFVTPVGAVERRNVARFLALAHRSSARAQDEISSSRSLGGTR